MRLLEDLIKKHKASVLLITHDLSIVAETCDRVGVMYAGDMAEVGQVDQIINSPKHPYTIGLMSALPSEERKELVGIRGAVPDLVNPPPGCRFHPRCDYARAICKEEKPRSVQVENNHVVACVLYEGRESERDNKA